MLKRLFYAVFVLAFITLSLPTLVRVNVSAADETIIIDNVLDLCVAMMSNGNPLNDSGTCDIYSEDQTDATINRVVYVNGNWVLKDLNLTFTRPNSPFYISSGSLTIDGGHYVSPNCVVWIQYRDGSYVPTTYVTINSGVFEATIETAYSTDSPSPVCLITDKAVSLSETQDIIAGYLPAGKRFVDITPRLRKRSMAATTDSSVENPIEADKGYAHIDKDGDILTEVNYLKTTLVEVVGEPVTELEESEDVPEPDKVEETGMGSVDEVEEETPNLPFIPKAPDTGIVK